MKNRKGIFLVIALLSALLMSITSIVNAKSTALSGEQGTKSKPYLISDANDLLDFANSVNAGNNYDGKYVLQTCDINLEGIEWPTIGLFETEYSFLGTYDGDGHIIENINVSVGGNNSFFGKLGGTVMNLGIESGNIS